MSHGCVRVLPHVAQFIYYNCPPGTTCVINRKKAADPELVKRLKKEIPAYADYKQPEDNRAYPPEIPAVIKYDGTPFGARAFQEPRIPPLQPFPAGIR